MHKSNRTGLSALLGPAALVATLAIAGNAAQATLSIGANAGQDVWETESGQSIPTGTYGELNGTLIANAAGAYIFTYGAPYFSLLGETGHGNATFANEFYVTDPVNSTRALAEAAGHAFCTQAIVSHCSATPLHSSFTASLPAGAISFHYLANNATAIDDGDSFNPTTNLGAYLTTLAPTSTSPGILSPANVAFLGLTDQHYAGLFVQSNDHDFQDLTVQVAAPEPATLALLGVGLAGLFKARRRRGVQ